jgi:ribosomal protein L31E
MRMIRGNALFAACSARRHHHHQHQYHHHHNYSATQLRAAGSVRPLHLHLAQGARRVTVAIKAEHPDRIWERRTPLVPDHVRLLIQSFPNQLTVNVESSQKRIFDDQSYANVCLAATSHIYIYIYLSFSKVDRILISWYKYTYYA